MCACFAPNPSVPVYKGDLYFDLETGELIPEVWEKFQRWDPVRMVDQHVDALKSLRWIHLQAGKEDEYGLHLGHRQLSKKMNVHGIEHLKEEYDGRHSGHSHRYLERVQKMLNRMV